MAKAIAVGVYFVVWVMIKLKQKNSELKHRDGYDVASFSGLIGMQMQGSVTIFTVNLKRIIKLMEQNRLLLRAKLLFF